MFMDVGFGFLFGISMPVDFLGNTEELCTAYNFVRTLYANQITRVRTFSKGGKNDGEDEKEPF